MDEITTKKLNLSNRAKNALLRARYFTIEEVMQLSEEDLYRVKNLGASSVREILNIQSLYKQYGLDGVIEGKILFETNNASEIDVREANKVRPLVIHEAYPEYAGGEIQYSIVGNKRKYYPDIDIINVGFSTRTTNGLILNKYKTINQVAHLEMSELKDAKHLGPKSISEIVNYFRSNAEIICISADVIDGEFNEIYNYIIEQVGDTKEEINVRLLEIIKYNLIKNIDEVRKMHSECDLKFLVKQYRFKKIIFETDQIKDEYKRYLIFLISNGLYEEKIDKESFFVNIGLNKKMLFNLMDAGVIEPVDYKYRIKLPNIEDWVNHIPVEKDAMAIKMRLEGKTLEECGKKLGVTRERIRQIIAKVVRKKPILREDDYKYWFEKYNFSREDFIAVFQSSKLVYNYLNLVYKGGFDSLEKILDDEYITSEIRESYLKHKGKNKVLVGDELVECNKVKICRKLGELNCSEQDISTNELYDIYNRFLALNDLENEKKLEYPSARAFEARIEDSRFFLSKYGKRVRYYPIDNIDVTEMVRSLNFEQFADIEISSLKLFRDNQEIMSEYDIRDEYELHNLLKKTENIWKSKEYSLVSLNRMPYISFGNADREKQTVEFLFRVAPVSLEEFCELYEMEFGVLSQTAAANFLPYISNYYHDGICSINQSLLDSEERKYMIVCLQDDFYFIDDIRDIYIKKYGDEDANKINPRTLKEMGFKLYTDYVVSSKFPSAYSYFKTLFTKEDLIDFRTLDKRLTYLNFAKSTLDDLRESYELLEYEDLKFIKLSRIQKVYPEVTIEMIEGYVDAAIGFLPEEDYFTVTKLKNAGFNHYLHEIGFGEWFNAGLIKNSRKIRFVKTGGDVIFFRGKKQITTKDFIEYLLKKIKKMDIYEFSRFIDNEYGIQLTKDKITQFIKSSDMYYDSIMEKIYLSKEYYYEEI